MASAPFNSSSMPGYIVAFLPAKIPKEPNINGAAQIAASGFCISANKAISLQSPP